VALDKGRLEAAIKDAIPAVIVAAMAITYPTTGLTVEQKAFADAERQKFATVIAEVAGPIADAIVDEIVNHAEVNVTSVSGVTSGGDTSGPGSGTIT